MKTPNTDPEWLRRMAAKEEGQLVSVGGWIQALETVDTPPHPLRSNRSAFSRLLQLARRERDLSLERFAEQTNIDLADLLRLENDKDYTPTPRTVHQIGQFLGLPTGKLMALAGLTVLKETQFSEAAVRFAARSTPVQKLSREEHEALEEFVSFLNDR